MNKIIKIGIVYSSYYKTLSKDDKVLIRVIEKYPNIQYTIFNWDENNLPINKNNFDFLLIRNTWTPEKMNFFSNWIEKIRKCGVLVMNDLEMILWNSSKLYLKELRDENLVNIIPSIFIKKGSIVKDLNKYIKQGIDNGIFNKDQIKFVLKPTVGAEGFGVESFSIASENTKQLNLMNQLLESSDVIIQPFLKSVMEEGEYSFIFINGKFSHSTIKTPVSGEYRVQESLGGQIRRIIPNQIDLDNAKSISSIILKKFKNPILYARIDMIRYNNKLCLNELDITEPNLYFLNNDELAENLLNVSLEIFERNSQFTNNINHININNKNCLDHNKTSININK